MNADMELKTRVQELVKEVLSTLALPLQPVVEEHDDCLRIRLDGDGGEVLLEKRAAARHELRFSSPAP